MAAFVGQNIILRLAVVGFLPLSQPWGIWVLKVGFDLCVEGSAQL
jgi:hypothetical protein